MKKLWILVLAALASPSSGIEPPQVRSVTPAADIDNLFYSSDGWIGADGAYSAALAPAKTLWLFSDTWVGKVREGRRIDATIVNNSLGIQDRRDERVSYTIGHDLQGKPTALLIPEDKRGFFWLQAGIVDGDQVSIFLNQVERTDDDSVFGFRSVGLWLATLKVTDQSPDRWPIEQKKMTNVEYSSDRMLTWGAAVLRVGEDLYVYGTDEQIGKKDPNRHMVLARLPVASIREISTWRYFSDGEWHEDFRRSTRLVEDMASEYSVTAFGKKYLAVYTDRGLSPRILGRVADNPWGPWSESTVLYECPEMGHDSKLFCYAAKAHPTLSADHEIVISYVVNSFDFWQVAKEANLYWPRFIRVTLAPSE